MVRYPSAAPIARVPRSRKDAHYQKGTPLPAKRGGIGVVSSLQADTVTVLISDEQVPGVIPLGKTPQVGSVVEVEARGDLLVIPPWADVDDVQGVPTSNTVATKPPKPLPEDVNLGGPDPESWYFTQAESPDWLALQAPILVGDGLEISHPAPTGPGRLWNVNDFAVRPGDVLNFALTLEKLLPSQTATVRLIVNYDAESADPDPSTGAVIAYDPVVPVDDNNVTLQASAVVSATFYSPSRDKWLVPGSARIGLLYTPSETGGGDDGGGPVTCPALSRPAGDTDPLDSTGWIDDPADYHQPADWPAGDGDPDTWMQPYFPLHVSHGAYGIAYVVAEVVPDGFENRGSQAVPEGAQITVQRVHMIYSSDNPIEAYVADGDSAQVNLSPPGELLPAGTQLHVVSEDQSFNFLRYARLFTAAEILGNFENGYSPKIHEWWVESEFT